MAEDKTNKEKFKKLYPTQKGKRILIGSPVFMEKLSNYPDDKFNEAIEYLRQYRKWYKSQKKDFYKYQKTNRKFRR